ncbi:MAG: ABC transporter substrate-binding protein [Anaerolineae bacterium]|nr:ABC transporter substrate-binding protein [Anaerolineae bacterium]MDW8099274.1 ABC transporter substrate-binding protein [Anaerolineae bacterium]
MSRRPSILRGLILLALILAACAPQAAPPAAPAAAQPTPSPVAREGGTIIVGLQAEPTTLDSQQISDYNSHRAAYGIYDHLLRFKDESTEVEPGLAESWEISEDGLVYTLYLRKGVKFHDGTDFNAEAVKFNLERQIDPNHPYHNTGEFPYAEFTWGMVKQIDVLDDYTVRITLKEPFAPFLNHLAMHPAAMASPAAIQKYGRDFSIHPVGTGPFKFVSWTPGVEVVLEKNPDYWRGAPKVDRVIYRPIIEDQARLTELEAGGVNFIVNVPPDELARLKQDPRFTVVEQPGMHTWWIAFNHLKAPFNDKRVRQAMNHAVNKQAIVDNILKGTGILAINPLPPVVWSYTDDVPRYDYDPEKAKQLLAEAGYPNGFSCSLWVPESGSGMQQPVTMSTAIQADLKAVGIDCKIEIFEWGTYLDKVIVPPEEAEYDLFAMSWIGDNGDPDNHLYILLSGDQWPPRGYNMGFYKNEEADALMREARTTLDRAKRTELYTKVQKLIVADAPWIIIDHETQIVVMDQKIKNFKLHPTGPFRFENVWIE